jgi:hypothetical protein
MSVLTELRALVEAQRRILSELEPGCLRGDDALALVELITEGERVLAAARTCLLKRVEESNVWRASGERSAAHLIAYRTGTTVGRARAGLETAERLERLPATAEAFRAGALSETQVADVADAASRVPGAEARLLDRARRGTVKQLRDECRRVKAAGRDAGTIYAAIRRDRCFRTWTDGDGGFNGAFRTTPDAGARILAALDAQIEVVFRAARSERLREPREAYAMDALESLVCSRRGGDAKERREIRVLVDHQALVRGHTETGEVCEIDGIGPVPVSVVESWRGDAYLRLIVTDGVDVKAITHRSRYVDAHQDAALRVRDRSCVIEGCDVTWRLERDHHVPFSAGGPTTLDNLQRLCGFHHALKTKGWRLTAGPEGCRLLPPGAERARTRASPARC